MHKSVHHLLNGGPFVIVLARNILWAVPCNCFDGGVVYRRTISLRVAQICDQGMPERVNTFPVVRCMNTNGDQITSWALVEELTNALGPAFLVMVSFAVSCGQVGEAVAKQFLLLCFPLAVYILKESQLEQLRMNRHLPSFAGLDPFRLKCLGGVSTEVKAGMPVDLLDVRCIKLCDLVGSGAGKVPYQWDPEPKWVRLGSLCGGRPSVDVTRKDCLQVGL